ncbi:MAG: hypothetical protein A3E25_16365 [Burkholderiales bacterium RIFCSPHIGHO2_12_FULL_69_20]|nr:MAG: hypothetical protein A3E25_16365 [Burkholderiales bacterium RIFCSPHIGHO2_12_FULL_69_20]
MKRLRRALVRGWLIGQKLRQRLLPRTAGPASAAPGAAIAPRLNGAVVLISGASRGIGAALAQAYAQAGARVVLTARSAAPLQALAARIVAAGGEALAVAGDLTVDADVQSLFDQTVRRFGGIDVLVMSAGTTGPHDRDAYTVTADEWTAVWRVNVEAVLRCVVSAAALARQQQRPLRVINVSSGIVGQAASRLGPYAASKDALEAATRALALDDASGLVSLCAIQPRSVRSDLTRGYYGAAMHELLDEPAVLAPVFLWAATAPAAVVNGRSFSEPALAADAQAASRLRAPFNASPAIGIFPVTFSEPGLASLPGAYLHLLENAQGFSPRAAEALREAGTSRRLFAYPDPQYRELTAAIAQEAGVSADHVLVAPGSSDLIDRMLRLFAGPGAEVVITQPSWSFFYAFVQRWQVALTQVPMRGSLEGGDLQHDLAGLLAAITPRTRLVYLVNPCNPTGTMVDPRALEAFVQRLPGHVVAIIDEAYLQYADPVQVPRLAEVLHRCAAPVVVLRTFSKFFGLGGMRLGYALSQPGTIGMLARADLPFAITTPAVIAAQAALTDLPFRQRVFEANQAGRRQLQDGLAALGLAAQPSQTNFVLFNAPVAPQTMREALRHDGLVLPQVDQFLKNYTLLAVGRPEHNAQVLAYLARH